MPPQGPGYPNYPEQPGYGQQSGYPQQQPPGYGQQQAGYDAPAPYPPAQPTQPTPPGYDAPAPYGPTQPAQPAYPPSQPGYTGPQQPPSQPGYPGYPGYTGGYAPPPGGMPPYGAPPPAPRRSNTGIILAVIGGAVILAIIAVVAFLAIGRPTSTGTASATATATLAPTNTPAPTATATSSTGNILYQDSMTDNPSGWVNDSSRGCTEQSDGYHVTGASCFAPGVNVGDAGMAVDTLEASTTSTSAFGIVFREADANDLYVFEISADGRWAAYKLVSGTKTFLQNFTANSAINTGSGATNNLNVIAIGSNFSFSVNGTTVGTATDSSISSGQWGVGSSSSTEIVFTNVLIISA